MQNSFSYEQTKEDIFSRPFFRVSGGHNNQNEKHIQLTNIGSRISDISLRMISGGKDIAIHITPTEVWEKGEKGNVTVNGFSGKPCPECVLSLSFTDQLERKKSIRYLIPYGTVCEFQPFDDSPDQEE